MCLPYCAVGVRETLSSDSQASLRIHRLETSVPSIHHAASCRSRTRLGGPGVPDLPRRTQPLQERAATGRHPQVGRDGQQPGARSRRLSGRISRGASAVRGRADELPGRRLQVPRGGHRWQHRRGPGHGACLQQGEMRICLDETQPAVVLERASGRASERTNKQTINPPNTQHHTHRS